MVARRLCAEGCDGTPDLILIAPVRKSTGQGCGDEWKQGRKVRVVSLPATDGVPMLKAPSTRSRFLPRCDTSRAIEADCGLLVQDMRSERQEHWHDSFGESLLPSLLFKEFVFHRHNVVAHCGVLF
jgi:transketolase